MNDAAIGALQAVSVASIVFGGQWVVARFSKKANEDTVEVDAQAKATEAWQRYAEKMETRLDGLEDRLEDQQAQIDEGRKRIGILERQSERDRELIRRLVTRLRATLNEIKRLGGSVREEDEDLADVAQLRLDVSDEQ